MEFSDIQDFIAACLFGFPAFAGAFFLTLFTMLLTAKFVKAYMGEHARTPRPLHSLGDLTGVTLTTVLGVAVFVGIPLYLPMVAQVYYSDCPIR